jgi:hypothetical protein
LKQNDLPCGKDKMADLHHEDCEIKYFQNPEINIAENTALEINDNTKQKAVSDGSPKPTILLRRTLCSLITFVVHCFELPVPSSSKSVTSLGVTMLQFGVLDAWILLFTLRRRTLRSLITFVLHRFSVKWWKI